MEIYGIDALFQFCADYFTGDQLMILSCSKDKENEKEQERFEYRAT